MSEPHDGIPLAPNLNHLDRKLHEVRRGECLVVSAHLRLNGAELCAGLGNALAQLIMGVAADAAEGGLYRVTSGATSRAETNLLTEPLVRAPRHGVGATELDDIAQSQGLAQRHHNHAYLGERLHDLPHLRRVSCRKQTRDIKPRMRS